MPPRIAATLGCGWGLLLLFLSLSGSIEQWDAVAGSSFLAATISGTGSLPGACGSPLRVSVCTCVRSGCGVSLWWCFCDWFIWSTGAFY